MFYTYFIGFVRSYLSMSSYKSCRKVDNERSGVRKIHEFLQPWLGGVVCKVSFVSNPTYVMLGWGWVELLLCWGCHNYSCLYLIGYLHYFMLYSKIHVWDDFHLMIPWWEIVVLLVDIIICAIHTDFCGIWMLKGGWVCITCNNVKYYYSSHCLQLALTIQSLEN